jgi:type II secretory pathway pseudopilin PulG
MAGGKVKMQKKLKASTIIEVLIAMILIIVVFGIAMMIFTNVVNSGLSVKKIRAEALLQQALLSAERSDNLVSQSVPVDDFTIVEEVKAYNGNTALTDIHLTALDQNQQKVAELEKVILKNNDR